MSLRQKRCPSWFVGAVMTLASLWALPAAAGNDDSLLLGDEAALTGGAVAAKIKDGTALWYNPAGLAAVDRDQADISASIFVMRYHRVKNVMSANGGEASSSITEFVAAPGALSYVRPLSKNLRIGLGVFVPQASDYTLRASLVPSQTDGSSRGDVSVGFTGYQYQGSIGLGWRVTPKLNLGVALLGSYNSVYGAAQFGVGRTVETMDFAAAASTLASNQYFGLELGVGAQLQLAPQWRLGVAVRSPGLVILRSVRDTTLTVAGVVTPDGASVEYLPEEEDEFRFGADVYSPMRVRIGVAHEWRTGWVSLEGDVQHGLKTSNLDVDREFVWNARLGGKVWLSEHFALGAGLFTDRSSSPTPDEFTETQLDFYGLATGLQYSSAHKLAADEPADDIVFSTTLGLRYAYGSGSMGNLTFDATLEDEEFITSQRSDYTVHELALHLGSALHF